MEKICPGFYRPQDDRLTALPVAAGAAVLASTLPGLLILLGAFSPLGFNILMVGRSERNHYLFPNIWIALSLSPPGTTCQSRAPRGETLTSVAPNQLVQRNSAHHPGLLSEGEWGEGFLQPAGQWQLLEICSYFLKKSKLFTSFSIFSF